MNPVPKCNVKPRRRTPRKIGLLVTIACVCLGRRAPAQTTPPGPAVLNLPASARTMALGDAWVAGRDNDVIFYNPAQMIGGRQEFIASLMRHHPSSEMGSLSGYYAAGRWSFTLGWGARVLNAEGDDASWLMTAGGAILVKGFRMGGALKYTADRVDSPGAMGDVGVARNLFGGVAAAALQHIGGPRQFLGGWSATRIAGPLDVGVYTQLKVRDEWTAPAAGLEVSYGWIEGYSFSLRAGARRPELLNEQPIAIGAGLTGDHLTIDYGIRFFDGGRPSHGVTIRWR